ncbi:MAG: GPW/gp25 family protein [Thermoproteota archaeon]|nr:GPW/gp25 family protein [Thermoproteota archaeon]
MRLNSMQFNYPLRLDNTGRTLTVNPEDHIRQLIEQLLFTNQGERVNRPTFGSGIRQLIFAPNSDEISTATQFLIQGSLLQWLADSIIVQSVSVSSEESVLNISVKYIVKKNQQMQVSNFTYKG